MIIHLSQIKIEDSNLFPIRKIGSPVKHSICYINYTLLHVWTLNRGQDRLEVISLELII